MNGCLVLSRLKRGFDSPRERHKFSSLRENRIPAGNSGYIPGERHPSVNTARAAQLAVAASGATGSLARPTMVANNPFTVPSCP
jgi:hypothetical protein